MKAHLRLPSTTLVSVLAALATWLTMTTWSGFSVEPWTYLGPLAIGCAIVAASGALLRAGRLHPILVVLGQTALLAIWLNHRLATDASLLGWIPTAESVRDSLDAIRNSVDAAKSYAAPVPRSVPAFPPIIIVVGSYLAVLVDLLACGVRRVPLAGLPLLAMYTAPVSMLETGVTWWKFALLALAFLALLAGEEATRLAHWGRDLGHEPGTPEPRWAHATNQTVWPSARKIGFTATAIAVVVPVLVPTISNGILGGTGSGVGDGSGGVNITNPMLDMKRKLEQGADIPALRVTTDDPSPQYLRLAVLDVYDGSAWKPSENRDTPIEHRVDEGIPAPIGLDSAVTATRYVSQMVADETFESLWLPVPYPVLEVNVPGDWRYDPSTMDIVSAAEGKDTAGIRYETLGLDVNPTAEDLRSAGGVESDLFRRYTLVADDLPVWLPALADDVTAAGQNKAEQAALLQDWFARPHPDPTADPSFSYSLSSSGIGSGIDDLRDFLLVSRTGYCEQFAGAMALMARTLDIPARVAVGFLRPDPVGGDTGTWIYSLHDLHAWPELYFDGVGWTRFEPTPSSRQGAVSPPYVAALQPTDNPTGPSSTSTTSQTAGATSTPSPTLRLPPEPVSGGSADQSGTPWLLIGLGIVPALLLVGALPRVVRASVRRGRWATADTATDQAEAAWAELRDSMIDLRMPWDDRVTVRQRAKDIGPLFRRRPGKGEEHLARIVTSNPEAQAALDRIVLLVERARYARHAPEVEDVKGDVDLCVASLRVGREPNIRRKADWLPVSLVNRSRRRTTKTGPGLATLTEPTQGN